MEFYQLLKTQIFEELQTSEKGLAEEESKLRLEKYGANKLKEEEGIKVLKLLISQFNSIVVYILIGAFLISLFLGEKLDAIVIGAIIILNTLLGFFQEYKAEKSIKALKKFSVPKTFVVRDGKAMEVDTHLLVPGDLVLLEAGSFVPSDCYLIESYELKTDESLLTGESVPVQKRIGAVSGVKDVGGRENMVFSGTTIVNGRGKGIAVATGMNSEVGKIAKMIQEEEEQTPLQKKLDKLGTSLGIAVIVIAFVILGTGIFRGEDLVTMILVSMSIAVAAIPEGLPAVVTISLAFGVQKMLKNNVLVRRLSSVETLGSTTVICADKTGTLTQNKMTVMEIYFNEDIIKVTDTLPKSKLLETVYLSNDVGEHRIEKLTDPTDIALSNLASKYKIEAKKIDEDPFTSEKKYSAFLCEIKGKRYWNYKLAVETALKMCKYIQVGDRVRLITSRDKNKILEVNEKMASRALRVLAFAYSLDETKKDLVFIGMTGMIDPPRADVKKSIEDCEKAGIKVIMVTGDHKITAQAIARQIGLGDKVITGEELDAMNDETLKDRVRFTDIFARVNPEHKVRILDSLKANGEIVAMTGDGINDAPALKKADIGVAVGTATDVAKDSSDMVLLDNNFTSIAKAVEEGRGIYDNIKKFVNYLLSSNMGEVMILFFAILLAFKVDNLVIIPLTAVQILWINLVTDGLPALALGVDNTTRDVMNRKPRNPKERIVDGNMWLNILMVGILLTIICLTLFKLNLDNVAKAQTVVFTSLVIFELGRVYMIRSQYQLEIFSNKWLIGAVLSSFILQLIVIYTPFRNYFDAVPLALVDWVFILISLVIFIAIGSLGFKAIKMVTKEFD
ncbi:calcium-translocating P-type ATPase, PMCA-type [Candidatus Woesearchaeota archaeon]|nr:calcium-translocating P-type ATPase, PMCA-type [Candidatus Woesearchaeota archaeon]